MRKTLFIFIMAVVTGTHAAVITHQETFNDVKVISPAKSTQTTCKTRVDLSEGLVDNTQGCDIEEILVYNKNHMWIGSLGGVEGGYHKRYADYDVDRYKGKGIQVGIEYSFTPQDADPSNRWMVSCPKGMIAYILDEYYSCKNPFTCANGMYAIDSLECEELPEGAHRNTTAGYSCNKGYIIRDGYCEEKAACGVNEAYNKAENTCLERPDNSHWIKNTLEWECNNGYVLQGDVCEKILKCDSASRYYAEYNTCVALPEFAYWNDSVSTDWTCDPGYVLYGAGCVEKATCSLEQRYDKSTNSCVDPYPNSRWVGDAGNYVCNDGFVDVVGYYGRCEEKAVCPDYHYDANNNSCYTKPEHSHWLSRYGSEWACDVGFVQIDEHCDVKAECDHYNSASNSCFEKPEHSHWAESTGEAWICDDGWWSNGNFCEEQVSCGWFERYNADNNTCASKPSHSHWTTKWNYACDDGYYETYGECVEINPINFKDYIRISQSVSFLIGGSDVTDKKDNSTTLFNLAAEYTLGVTVGTDFLSVRPHLAIGLLYSIFEYTSTSSYSYLDERVYSTAFLNGIGIGFDVWHIAFDYTYMYAMREELSNVEFYSDMHQFKIGYKFNEHVDVNFTIFTRLLKSASILSDFDKTNYNIGVTYAF